MKTKFKKGDRLVESCGCLYIILKVGINYYIMKSASSEDNDTMMYSIKDVEGTFSCLRKGKWVPSKKPNFTLWIDGKPCPFCKKLHAWNEK
jgi:hypothetical protein